MKKMWSILLAVALMLACAPPAVATEPQAADSEQALIEEAVELVLRHKDELLDDTDGQPQA